MYFEVQPNKLSFGTQVCMTVTCNIFCPNMPSYFISPVCQNDHANVHRQNHKTPPSLVKSTGFVHFGTFKSSNIALIIFLGNFMTNKFTDHRS